MSFKPKNRQLKEQKQSRFLKSNFKWMMWGSDLIF